MFCSIDQPLLLCSFANTPIYIPCGEEGSKCQFEATGLFCALSQDEGAFPAHSSLELKFSSFAQAYLGRMYASSPPTRLAKATLLQASMTSRLSCRASHARTALTFFESCSRSSVGCVASNIHPFLRRYKSAEPDGYNDMAVSDSGSIDLITSKNHYRFNLAWMLQRADPPPC